MVVEMENVLYSPQVGNCIFRWLCPLKLALVNGSDVRGQM
jgi:hypothetical protein